MLFKNKIKEDIKFSQKGNIWRIFIYNNLLLGETREHTTKNAYLFTMNFKTGEIFLKNKRIEEKWWFSINGFTDNYIYISKFKKPDMPDQLGFMVLEFKTGQVLWNNDNLVYLFSDQNYTYAYKKLFDTKTYYKLNSSSGSVISEIKENGEIAQLYNLKEQVETLHYKNFTYTEIFNTEIDANDYAGLYLTKKIKGINLKGPVEYILHKNLLLYNYHKQKKHDLTNVNGVKCDNIFEIVELQKLKLLYIRTLNKNTAGYAPDSFFINSNHLFFIKDKNTLNIINLEKWK